MKRLLSILLAGSLLFGQVGCASRSYNYSSYKEEQAATNNLERTVGTSDWSNVLRLVAGESVTVTLNDGSKVKGITDSTADEFIAVLTATQAKNQIARQNVVRVERIIIGRRNNWRFSGFRRGRFRPSPRCTNPESTFAEQRYRPEF